MIQQQQRSSTSRRRPSETLWGAVMWTLTWFLVMVLLALVGVGTWRFIDQAQEYADRRSSIKELDEEIIQLIDQINNISGLIPNSCTVNVNNLTQPLEYPDDEFQIFSDQDNSSGIVFDLLGPGSNVSLSVQNTSGIIAYLAQIEEQSVIFFDDEFAVFNAAITSKVVMLDLSSISAMTIQTLSIQDASGTIAYLSDIPPEVNTFLDDEFTVYSVGDSSKKVMLDCSIIASSTVQTMTVQDASGTIAYLGDIANLTGVPFPDDEFFVHADGDTTTRVMLDANIISTMTTVVMTIQDRSGVIAYLSDLIQVVEVFMDESRPFPDATEEGVSTLSALGDISLLEITMCGAGGAGGVVGDSTGSGGGGGGGFQNFRVVNAASRFEYLNISMGIGGHVPQPFDAPTTVGGPTVLIGISTTGFSLHLTAYGGGGGASFVGGTDEAISGGGGGGGGGPAVRGSQTGFDPVVGTPGPSGPTGGLQGGFGAFYNFTTSTLERGAEIGPYRLPWRSGGGGGLQGSTFNTDLRGASWQGGYSNFVDSAVPIIFSQREGAVGAGSIFGPGGDEYAPGNRTYAGYCSGGGIASSGNPQHDPNMYGGDGAALIRYYIK